MQHPDRIPIRDYLWLFVALGLSSAWCLTAGQRLGATFDEPIYLQRGLDGWRTGSHHGLLRLGTMPLPGDVQTLPLYLIERATGQQWNLDSDFSQALVTARAMTLLFWWLLLLYGFWAGRMMAGRWGGNLAVAILACEPNLLAHASLATTDIAVTACLLAFLVHYRSGRDARFGRRVIVPGIWFGIALTAKASALVFAPLCMIAIELERWFSARVEGGETFPSQTRVVAKQTIWTFWRESVQIGLFGLLVTFLYCGCDWQTEPSFVAWANGLPEGIGKSTMSWLADHLRIFSNAGEGIARQIKHNLRGHGVYLLGESSDHAIWYYFPVLFTIKLAVPLLVALTSVVALRPSALRNWALACAGILLLFSFNCRVQLGIRLVLPCVALFAVGLGAAIAGIAQRLGDGRGRSLIQFAVSIGIGWMALDSVSVWPDGLRFINELWRGRRPAYEIVSDSNYDWGQGLPNLAHWQAGRGVADLDVWYFGTDPQLTHRHFHELPLHVMPIQSTSDVQSAVAGRMVAVGTTALYGYGLTESHRRAAEYLRTCRPIGRTTTFLIFDFRNQSPELVHNDVAETKP
jgi:hypothetical protein